MQAQRGLIASSALIALGAMYLVAALRARARKWVAGSVPLFAIFLIGPCEPLIPLMFTGPLGGPMSAVIIALIYAVATIATMLAAVFMALRLSHYALRYGPAKLAHVQVGHVYGFAGFTMIGCGAALMGLGI